MKEQGADPGLVHLGQLLPDASEADAAAIHAALDYLDPHAQPGRTEYPAFAAQGLVIASGTVESSCRTVVCQRTKSSGMGWRGRGAQSVLALRRPPVTSPRMEDHAA